MSVRKIIKVDNLVYPNDIVKIIEKLEKLNYINQVYIDYDKGEFTVVGDDEFTQRQIDRVKSALLITETTTQERKYENSVRALRNILTNEHSIKEDIEHDDNDVSVETKQLIIKYQDEIEQYNIVSRIVNNEHHDHDEDHQHEHEEGCSCGLHHGHDHGHHHGHHHGCSCCGDEDEEEESITPLKIVLFVLGIALFVTAIVLKLTMGDHLFIRFIFIASYLLIGYNILWNSIVGIIHGDIFNENLLMVIASAGALAIDESIEAVMVILLYKIGEFFQDKAADRSRDAIKELMELKVDKVTLSDGSVVDVSEVEVGDIISVKVGERIPLDGVIKSGSTDVDMKALTGESKPVFLDEGNEILSGSVNLSKVIEVEVTKKDSDSVISKVMKLVEEASTQKSKKEEFIHKFARIYTPIVIGIAIIIGLLLFFAIGKDIKDTLNTVFTILVISCPCALVISIPLAYYAGIGRSSSDGILVKGGTYLDFLAKKGYFVFDKTGTITKGNFKVSDIYEANGKTKEEVLELIAKVEVFSSHPIAQAITNQAKNKELDSNYEVEEISGKGMKVITQDEVILVGNERLMQDNKIKYTEPSEVGTVLYLAVDKVFYGSIVIVDEIKPESYDCIDFLNKKGNQTVMLTGDTEDVAKDVADKVGITEYSAKLLPRSKFNWIKKKIKNGDNVVYVGDGINDSPSLRIASVGIAMGISGSDSAKECADVVIVDDNLNKLVDAIKISKFTQKIITENIVLALAAKVAALVIGTIGILGPMAIVLAIFSDVGVCLLAILNAMRILKLKIK